MNSQYNLRMHVCILWRSQKSLNILAKYNDIDICWGLMVKNIVFHLMTDWLSVDWIPTPILPCTWQFKSPIYFICFLQGLNISYSNDLYSMNALVVTFSFKMLSWKKIRLTYWVVVDIQKVESYVNVARVVKSSD